MDFSVFVILQGSTFIKVHFKGFQFLAVYAFFTSFLDFIFSPKTLRRIITAISKWLY